MAHGATTFLSPRMCILYSNHARDNHIKTRSPIPAILHVAKVSHTIFEFFNSEKFSFSSETLRSVINVDSKKRSDPALGTVNATTPCQNYMKCSRWAYIESK